MKTPLNGGEAIIRTMLREHWQLTVSNIHFIPFGESAYSYRVETDTHTSYYLKIVDRQTNVDFKRKYGQFSATAIPGAAI